MKKILILALAISFTVVTVGCRTRVTDFTVLSSKNLDFTQMGQCKRGSARITGKDTAYIIIFIPTGVPNMKTALDRAIESVPGAVALVDGVVYADNWWFIVGANSYIVEGTPLIDPNLVGKAHAMKSNFMLSYYSAASQRQELKYVDEATYKFIKRSIQAHDTSHINEVLSKLN